MLAAVNVEYPICDQPIQSATVGLRNMFSLPVALPGTVSKPMGMLVALSPSINSTQTVIEGSFSHTLYSASVKSITTVRVIHGLAS